MSSPTSTSTIKVCILDLSSDPSIPRPTIGHDKPFPRLPISKTADQQNFLDDILTRCISHPFPDRIYLGGGTILAVYTKLHLWNFQQQEPDVKDEKGLVDKQLKAAEEGYMFASTVFLYVRDGSWRSREELKREELELKTPRSTGGLCREFLDC